MCVYQCELMNTDPTLLQKVDELSARVVTLETENRLLRQKLDQYIRHYFGGQRNECLDKHQLELLLQGLPNVIALPAPEPKTTTATRNGQAHPVRRMLVEDKLEIQEIVIEPAEVQAQPDGWKKISEERTSQLDWVAPKIIKRVYIRPRYVKQERFALAQLPAQPIEQGMVGPGLLAQILVSKYEYHQPLYRQEKMFRQQFGVELSRKTMGCWVEQAAELLKPVYRAIREDLLRGNYLQADETPIRYLDPDVKGKSQQGYLWVYSRPKGDVLFEWRVSRSRAGPEEFLKNFRGTFIIPQTADTLHFFGDIDQLEIDRERARDIIRFIRRQGTDQLFLGFDHQWIMILTDLLGQGADLFDLKQKVFTFLLADDLGQELA